MIIRDLTTADIDGLRDLDRVSFDDDDQYDAAYYEEVIASKAFDAIGAVDESGHPVGWVLLDLSRHPIRIRSLSVHPDARRRGVATALVKAALSRYGASIDLLVARANAGAIGLYRSLGFSMADPDPELPQRARMVRR